MPSSKKNTLRISDLSDSEADELKKFFEGHGMTAEKEAEISVDEMRAKLAEYISGKSKNAFWTYYMLGDMLTTNAQLDEAIAMYSRATQEYPKDPRAWYSLGVMHRAISIEPERRKNWEKELAKAKKKDEKLAENMQKWEKQNQKFLLAASESKLAETPVETANTALSYFQKALACNISDEDKERLQKMIESIEEWNKSR